MEMENKERKKFAEILDLQYMSSEESEEEDALKLRPIPWLSIAADQFKKILDEERQSS